MSALALNRGLSGMFGTADFNPAPRVYPSHFPGGPELSERAFIPGDGAQKCISASG